jgi:hypothetical protein
MEKSTKRVLTISDFLPNSDVKKYNNNTNNGSKVENFRKQGEYGQRKRIKP